MNSNELQIFNYENNEIRTAMKNGEIWWVLKDVCKILGLNDSHKVALRLGKDERNQIPVTDSIGRQQKTTIVNEPGLYKVIFRSDKPEAKKFMNWVTHEVLPSVRKHGAYITSEKMEELMANPDTWIKLIHTLQQERREKANLQKQIELDKPKIVFANAVSVSESDILIGELAKILKGNGIEIGPNRLFEHLRQKGFLVRRNSSDYNTPTQRSMALELFKVKETAITHSDGHVTISKTVKVTGKGQLYFINLFLGSDNQKPFLNTAKKEGAKNARN